MKLLALTSLCALVFSTYAYIHSPEEYNKSLKQWKNLRLKNYSYTTFTPGSQLDITTTTTITVKNGKGVKREFTYDDRSEYYFDEETGETSWNHYSWIEKTPKELGSHDEGFIPITLDDFYDQCGKNILTQDPVGYSVVFGSGNNGLISECTYYPMGLSDDVASGVLISSIKY